MFLFDFFFFRLCNPLSFRRKDIAYFSYHLAGFMAHTVQNNNARIANIAKVCDKMLQDESRHLVRINCNNPNLNWSARKIILKSPPLPIQINLFHQSDAVEIEGTFKHTAKVHTAKEIYF